MMLLWFSGYLTAMCIWNLEEEKYGKAFLDFLGIVFLCITDEYL